MNEKLGNLSNNNDQKLTFFPRNMRIITIKIGDILPLTG